MSSINIIIFITAQSGIYLWGGSILILEHSTPYNLWPDQRMPPSIPAVLLMLSTWQAVGFLNTWAHRGHPSWQGFSLCGGQWDGQQHSGTSTPSLTCSSHANPKEKDMPIYAMLSVIFTSITLHSDVFMCGTFVNLFIHLSLCLCMA